MVVVVTALVATLLWLAFVLMLRRERRRLIKALLLMLALFATSLAIWGLAGSSSLGQSSLGVRVFGGTVALLFLTGLALPMALVVNGVIMWRREGHSLGNSLALLTGLTLLVVTVLPVLFAVLAAPEVLFWLSMGITGIVSYLGALFVSYLTYGWLYGRLGLCRPSDAVVVLGAGIISGNVPPLLASRLDKAIETYSQLRDQGHPVVLVPTGGQGEDESAAEGVTMTRYLLDRDIPRAHILTEDQARTTRENIINSRELLTSQGHGTRLTIVTNDYHALRAAVLSRLLRVDAEAVGSKTSSYYLPSATLREFVALLVAARGWHLAICIAILTIATWIGLVT